MIILQLLNQLTAVMKSDDLSEGRRGRFPLAASPSPSFLGYKYNGAGVKTNEFAYHKDKLKKGEKGQV